MDLKLEGKRALVTGSTRGIGRSIAESLGREGCRVAVNGRNAQEVATTVAALGGAVACPGDVLGLSDLDAMRAELERSLGGLDIIVCNVGSGRSVPPGTEDRAEWQRVFELNLLSTTNTVESLRPLLGEGGVIVCTSSICGSAALGAPLTYSAAKAALDSYVRGLARVLGAEGKRVLGVAPGNILFPGSVWERKLGEDRAGVEAMLEREVAVRRLGRPEEIGDFVAFLCSPRAQFLTAQVYVADGGQLRA